MNTKYKVIIQSAKEIGGMLDAMRALQNLDGYLTQEAIEVLAEEFQVSPAEIYDAASFYSMIQLTPPSKINIRICRGAVCHVAGSAEVIKAIENALGIQIGNSTKDGRYSFDYTECLGQCQAAPAILVNEKLYTDMTGEKFVELLKTGGFEV